MTKAVSDFQIKLVCVDCRTMAEHPNGPCTELLSSRVNTVVSGLLWYSIVGDPTLSDYSGGANNGCCWTSN